MKRAELVFIPSPGAGHLSSTVEIAKLLVDRDDRLSITILAIKLPFETKVVNYAESLAASNLSSRIQLVNLPDGQFNKESFTPKTFQTTFIENKKPYVKEAVTKLTESPDSPQLAGFVLDMFCTCMADVADEFGVPSYIFYTSSAAYLGLMLHVQALHDEQNRKFIPTELNNSDAELKVPSLVNPVPAKVLPTMLFYEEWDEILYEQARGLRRAKGILVNTFEELESHALKSFSEGKTKLPPVYPVGPVLNLEGQSGSTEKIADIMTWLDHQPESSVVFLCFGSMGSFGEEQVGEIARALERSGHRFLWSLRRDPPKGKFYSPADSGDPTDVLPKGFLDRTAEIGKVIGWAPQVAILAHPAVGGFVSHCGWNSILESIWFGVPVATWPVFMDQQLNAFQLVKELGLAAEIKMDYRKDYIIDNPAVVNVGEIEKGITCLMEHDNEMRKRVKQKSDEARNALMDRGGSSLDRLINAVFDNI